MNDIAEHESRFHDYGEQVDDPYPQMSEHPLRSGVMKLTADNGDGTYTATEQVWAGAAWTNGTAPGQYVGVTVRDIASSTAGAVNDYVPFWEQYTQAGVIELIVAIGAIGTDEKVATASGETPGYLEDVTAGHDPWIVLTESGGTLTTAHGPPGASCYKCACILVGMDIDVLGHVRCFESDGWRGPCA